MDASSGNGRERDGIQVEREKRLEKLYARDARSISEEAEGEDGKGRKGERSHLDGELKPRTLQSDTTDRSQLRDIDKIEQKLMHVHGKLRCVSNVCSSRYRGRTAFWVCPSSWMPSSPRERELRQP